MTDFDPIASSLRDEGVAFYSHAPKPSSGVTTATLETNSGYVERRSRPLVELYERRSSMRFAGAAVLDVGCGFGAMSAYFAAHGASVTAIDPKPARLTVGRNVA